MRSGVLIFHGEEVSLEFRSRNGLVIWIRWYVNLVRFRYFLAGRLIVTIGVSVRSLMEMKLQNDVIQESLNTLASYVQMLRK